MPAQAPCEGDVDTNETFPEGSVSVSVTPVASAGPPLVTVIVYVRAAPTLTQWGESVLVTESSAWGVGVADGVGLGVAVDVGDGVLVGVAVGVMLGTADGVGVGVAKASVLRIVSLFPTAHAVLLSSAATPRRFETVPKLSATHVSPPSVVFLMILPHPTAHAVLESTTAKPRR